MDESCWYEKYKDMLFDSEISHREIGKFLSLYFPKKLYRYRRFSSHWKDEIFNGHVHISKSSELNDPFDCLVYVDDDLFQAKIIDNVKKICKQKGNNIYNVINLKKNDIDVEDLKNIVRVACFTESNNNQLMWSHYADSHKGFCIEYNFKKVKPKYKSFIFPVIYSDVKYDATNDVINKVENNFINPFFVKSNVWKYEKEWRLIYPSERKDENKFNISFESIIEAIYFGVNVEKNRDFDEVKCEIIEWARNNKVKVYQMKIDYRTFDIIPEKLA